MLCARPVVGPVQPYCATSPITLQMSTAEPCSPGFLEEFFSETPVFRHSKFLRHLGPVDGIVSWRHSLPSASGRHAFFPTPRCCSLGAILAALEAREEGPENVRGGSPKVLCLMNYLYLRAAAICSGENLGHPLNSVKQAISFGG